MHKRPVDRRHAFQHILQALAQVVAVAQTHVLIQHDVDLDVELVARVVGLQTLDGLDGLGEAHGEVEEHVTLVGGGGGAGEVADVLGRGRGPVQDDEEREQQAPQGVEPPHARVEADQREDDGEGVEDDVGQRVLRERLHGAVLDQPAPDEAETLDGDGRGHDEDRRERELHDRVLLVGEEALEAFERYLEKGGYHDHGEDQDADGFETSPADRVGVLVLAGDEFGGGPDNGGGEKIEGGVDEGGEHREGRCQDNDGDFTDEQEKVGNEVDEDCYGYDAGLGVDVFVSSAVLVGHLS